MNYPLRAPANRARAHWASSISQYDNALAVIKNGEIVPIAFDVIDFIKYDPIDKDCEQVVTHKAIVTSEQAKNYDHPVATCTYWTDTYLLGEVAETVLEELPSYIGPGMFQKFVNYKHFTNDETGESLGIRNKVAYRVGVAYASGSKTLLAAKRATRP